MIEHEPIAVLGCGRMGAAVARALAGVGHPVTVWNRTFKRAEALAAENIEPVVQVSDAVASSNLVISVCATYTATREVLSAATDLRGRTVISLCSGTPAEAEHTAEWVTGRGGDHLDGAVIAFPDFIGHPDALLAFSGPSTVFDRHREALDHLGGRVQLLDAGIGAAKVLDVAVIGSFYIVAVSAYVDSVTYALSQGVPADLLREATRLVLRTIGHSGKEATHAITTDEHTTEQASLDTYLTGARSMLAAMHAAGHNARILAATVENLEAAHRAGFGELGLYSQSRVAVSRSQPGRDRPSPNRAQ